MDKDTSAGDFPSREYLMEENGALRARLEEAEETLRAIRHGEVDALLVSGPDGAQVFTLESAEQPYRILIEQMQEGAVTLSQEGTVLYCNLRFSQMLKIPHEKLLASRVQALAISTQAEQFEDLIRLGSTQSVRAEITLGTGDGRRMPTYITVSPLPVDVEGGICMIVTDLTEQESMRYNHVKIEALNLRLRRAMTETHHRVKNSLQITSALVDVYLSEHKDFVPAEMISRLNLQVRAMATVHDLLTQQTKEDGEGNIVSSKTLLGNLLPMLENIAAPRLLKYTVDEAWLLGRQPTALALIINELVLNALKHGKGEVQVTFCCQGTDAVLEVCDDGEGLLDGFDPEVEAGTGIDLIRSLASWDLRGSIQYENRSDRKGAQATVTFPLTRL